MYVYNALISFPRANGNIPFHTYARVLEYDVYLPLLLSLRICVWIFVIPITQFNTETHDSHICSDQRKSNLTCARVNL